MVNPNFPQSMKNIIIRKGVIRTAVTDVVIERLDPYFLGLPIQITSVLRTAESQLAIIEYYAKLKELIYEGDILNFTSLTMFEGRNVFKWQLVWSQLLSIGIIANPPKSATVLKNYIVSGINKKGMSINPSEHIYGSAFDIGGAAHGVDSVYKIIVKAAADKIGIRYSRIERGNNCVHVAVIN